MSLALSTLLAADQAKEVASGLADWLHELGLVQAELWLSDGLAGVLYQAWPPDGKGVDRPLPQSLDHLAANEAALVADDLLVGVLRVNEALAATARTHADLIAAVVLSKGRQDRSNRDHAIMRDQLAGLTAAGHLLRHLDIDTLLVKVLEMAMQGVSAQVGALLTADENGILTPHITWGMRDSHVGALRLKTGAAVVDHVMQTGEALLVPSEQIAAVLDTSGLDAALSALLALPLGIGARRRGVVVLANPARAFGVAQQRLAETVCGMAAIAVENAILVKSAVDQQRLQSEMDLARQVQLGMYPTEGLKVGAFDITGLARPCTETGGDYYTFVQRHEHLLLMIGDVSGHGLGAALYTTTAHAVLHQQLRAEAGAGSAMRVINESLFSSRSGRFMTAAIVEVDPASKSFTYHSAGHNPLLWIHQGTVEWLESTAMPLGIVESNPSEEAPPRAVASGDVLVLYTDGITEAADVRGELLGERRLGDVVLAAADGSADDIVRAVLDDFDAFTAGAPIADDVTLVVIKVG